MNFKNVLFVGPQNEKGGIGAVLNLYKESMDGFRILSTYPADVRINIYRFFCSQYIKLFKLLITDNDIQILHIHSASRGSFVRKSFVLFMAKAFGKKTIMHIHGGMFREYYQSSRIKSWYVRFILQMSDRVLCLTEEWRQSFQSEMQLNNLEVLLNPVKKFPKNNINITHSWISLLFMGTITENKGIFELVEYLQQNTFFLQGKIKLYICGEGDDKKLSMCMPKGNFRENIVYTGWIDGVRKNEILQSADIFILPSHYEGLPMAILEAMSAGKPIISTRVGGIPSVVKPSRNGWLIDPKHIAQLDSIVEEIFNTPDIIARFGTNAMQDAEAFHVEGIVSQLSNIYKALFR